MDRWFTTCFILGVIIFPREGDVIVQSNNGDSHLYSAGEILVPDR